MRVAAAVAAIALAGCSVLVGSGRGDPMCVQPDPMVNPCEGAFSDSAARCVEGFCQRTASSPEACDSVDNDGDGIVDEGLDNDGDGFSWCPTAPAGELGDPGGEIDCVDTNADIHPPGPDGYPDEVCDGADNDCDGMTDEAPRTGELCPMMQRCYPERGGCDWIDCRDSATGCPELHSCDTSTLPATCVVVAEDCTVIPCTGTQRCDPLSRGCTDPLPNGAACTDDIVCQSNHCFTAGSLDLASSDLGGAMQICSAPCCSDTDCALDEVCWAPGTGARGCVSRAVIDSGPEGPVTPINCTSELNCPRIGELCGIEFTRAYRDDELVLTACTPFVGSGRPGSPCDAAADCDTGLCITTGVFLFEQVCSEPCGEVDDCSGILDRCIYGVYATMSDTDYIQVCGLSPPWLSLRSDREGCSDNSDCLEGACLNSVCAKTCCADRQCGSDRTCEPVAINGRWEMHCVP